jgi:sarcosine oxidase subunit alpha
MTGEAVQAGARLLTGVTAFGVFEAGLVAAFDAGHLYRIRPRHTIFATGAYDQPAVFPNNDLPGIMLSGAVDRLLHLYRILPGRLAVVAAFEPAAYQTAYALARDGARVVASIRARTWIVKARGRPPRPVEGAATAPPTGHGGKRFRSVGIRRPTGPPGSSKPTCWDVGLRALAPPRRRRAWVHVRREHAGVPSRAGSDGVHAGAVTGAGTLGAILSQGRLAGLEAPRRRCGTEGARASRPKRPSRAGLAGRGRGTAAG